MNIVRNLNRAAGGEIATGILQVVLTAATAAFSFLVLLRSMNLV